MIWTSLSHLTKLKIETAQIRHQSRAFCEKCLFECLNLDHLESSLYGWLTNFLKYLSMQKHWCFTNKWANEWSAQNKPFRYEQTWIALHLGRVFSGPCLAICLVELDHLDFLGFPLGCKGLVRMGLHHNLYHIVFFEIKHNDFVNNMLNDTYNENNELIIANLRLRCEI